MSASEIGQFLAKVDALRRRGEWRESLKGYVEVLKFLPNDATIAHNISLCHLALGDSLLAQSESLRAMHLKPSQWQSVLIHSKALVANGQNDQALAFLEGLICVQPDRPEVALELAKLVMQHGGDAARACDLVRPFLHTAHGRDAELVWLAAQLYDRDPEVSAQNLSDRIGAFSQAHLQLPNAEPVAESVALKQSQHNASRLNSKKRLKIGLLSPQFSVSPVYFFTFGALQLMSNDVDLVFFSRGKKSDWATRNFQTIAVDWVDVSICSAEQLAVVLAANDLDVLIDLGGWMDPVGLQALSVKPAKKMFKWVGGQSATTGLRCFDGYITDCYQSPQGSERFFSEPLVRLESGYVTYTPPPYLPKPIKQTGLEFRLGVIANPVKLSRVFLTDLAVICESLKTVYDHRPVLLHLVDKRYAQKNIQERILNALPGVDVRFVVPVDHLAYLTAISGLSATLDTWPYSGGLTTIEALAVGVPSFTRIGDLFCERHSLSHFYYAGLKLSQCSVETLTDPYFKFPSRQSLLTNKSQRMDHDALARELLFSLHLV
jgi:hypothetical protein